MRKEYLVKLETFFKKNSIFFVAETRMSLALKRVD